MSFRPPSSFSPTNGTGLLALDYELAAEKADALGRAGRKVEAALAALAKARAEGVDPQRTHVLIDQAAELVWAFFIQREICGFHSPSDAVERYRIPPEVLARVGAGPGR
ncbi:MAG: hypothetical protein K0M49_01625 [Arenimonas sp.]|nr:hypothetical protein [Rhizobium sp.]MBW8444304.1 hypothetical protein [Arenimonas sp.]